MVLAWDSNSAWRSNGDMSGALAVGADELETAHPDKSTTPVNPMLINDFIPPFRCCLSWTMKHHAQHAQWLATAQNVGPVIAMDEVST